MTTQKTPLLFEFFNEIGIINQLATARFAKVLAPHLNTSEFGVLNHLSRMGDGKTQTYLAKAFQVSKPSMTAILGKLSGKGFVLIKADPDDGRTKRVMLTDEGRDAWQTAVAHVAPLNDELKLAISNDDLAKMLPGLRQLRAVMDEARNSTDGIKS